MEYQPADNFYYFDIIPKIYISQKKIKDNEATALKLLGAIETLEYLNPTTEEEETEEETTTAAE